MPNLAEKAEAIADQYLAQLPPDHAGRFSAIADTDTVAMLLQAFESGLNQRDSCLAAGINPRTFQRWQDEADAHPDSAHATLVALLKEQRAKGKLWHLQNIKRHALKEWEASGWTLERTDTEQFGKDKERREGPQVIVINGLRTDQVTFACSTQPLSLCESTASGDVVSDK